MKSGRSSSSFLYIFVFVIGAFALGSCEYDNEEDLYADFVCDLSDTKYTSTIQPILAANCYACHDSTNAPNAGEGVVLEGYDAMLPYIMDSTLYRTIIWDDCCTNMPYQAEQLQQCNIDQIKQWIDNGALDN